MRKDYFTRCATIFRDALSRCARCRVSRPSRVALEASKRLTALDRRSSADRSLLVIYESANQPSACNEHARTRRGALSSRGARNQQAQTLHASLQQRTALPRAAGSCADRYDLYTSPGGHGRAAPRAMRTKVGLPSEHASWRLPRRRLARGSGERRSSGLVAWAVTCRAG
jgi:hypothetical protein